MLLPYILGYHIYVFLGHICTILLIVNDPSHQGQGAAILINLGKKNRNKICSILSDGSIWELNIIDHGVQHWVVVIFSRNCYIRDNGYMDHFCRLEAISVLEYNFTVDKRFILWLLIDQTAIDVYCVLNIRDSYWFFIVIPLFFLFIIPWWSHCSASIQDC